MTSMTSPTDDPIPANHLVDRARQDLARRLKIDESQIEALSFEIKVWPDGSLGCPKPGMEYIQVLVEGYLIRLRYQGVEYNYHGGETRGPFLCEQGLDKPGVEYPQDSDK